MTMISFFTVSVNVLCFHVTYRKEIEKVLSAPPVGHCLLRFDALKKQQILLQRRQRRHDNFSCQIIGIFEFGTQHHYVISFKNSSGHASPVRYDNKNM